MSWGLPYESALRRALPLDFPASRPIYVASSFDLDSRLLYRPHVFAWTAPDLDLALRSHLDRCGLWRGRGFATIVNEQRIVSALADVGQVDHFGLVVTNIVLHEAAHYFGQYDDPCSVADDDEPSAPAVPATATTRRASESALLSAACFAASAPDPVARCDGHGPDFIRAALHVCARASQHGIPTCHVLMHVQCPGWSHPDEYLDALDGEPERRIDEPLRVVLADDPPPAFTALADADRAAQTAGAAA